MTNQAYYLNRAVDFSPVLTDTNKFIYSIWFKPASPTVYTLGVVNYVAGLLTNFITTNNPTKSLAGFNFLDGTASGDRWNMSIYYAGNPLDSLDPVLIQGFFYGTDGTTFGFDTGGVATTLLMNEWNNFLMSYDGDTGDFNLAVNDVVLSQNLGANAALSLAVTSPGPQADFNIGYQVEACLAYCYFNLGEYLDFSVTANRRLFLTAGLAPADLGATGSTPTGSTPTIYLPLNASSPGTNASGHGNFTVTYPSGTPAIEACS